ncbi:hypothetical protein BSKO_12366 [Bryopsis sp. KO-2023]|nr:hypothetical protein BSKO_12366 [Bryopsis sp. KO-2023]
MQPRPSSAQLSCVRGSLLLARPRGVAAVNRAPILARKRLVCRASQDEESKGADVKPVKENTTDPTGAPVTGNDSKEQQPPPGEEKGQLTAIITGAASIILGVLYLVLVQFLDSRGANMLPPPPEAFLQ